MNFAETCAKHVVRNRKLAADKTYQYRTRLMFDKCAARWEQALINKANTLISQHAV
jgi:hypothetical protein